MLLFAERIAWNALTTYMLPDTIEHSMNTQSSRRKNWGDFHDRSCLLHPRQPATRPPGPAPERRYARRFPRCPALRRPDARRRLLPPAGHAERALPDAWRAQHRPAHGRGPRPLRRRPPHPRLLLGRDGRPPPRWRRLLPPHGRALGLAQDSAHRWARAPSAESVESLRGEGPDISGRRHRHHHLLGLLRVSAAPRGIFQRPQHTH